LSICSFSQTDDTKIRLKVLLTNNIDSTYVFGNWTDSTTETHLTYLGSLTTEDGKSFKILTSSWIWGLSHRATNRILIYDENNLYLGNYYIDSFDELPTKLDGSNLVFETLIDNDLIAVNVELKDGLPDCIITDIGERGCFE